MYFFKTLLGILGCRSHILQAPKLSTEKEQGVARRKIENTTEADVSEIASFGGVENLGVHES